MLRKIAAFPFGILLFIFTVIAVIFIYASASMITIAEHILQDKLFKFGEDDETTRNG